MRSKLRQIAKLIPFLNHAKRNHPVEYALIRGNHQNDNQHPSILHFSLNKSATQYVKKILHLAAVSKGMTVAHLNGYAFHSDFPYLDLLDKQAFQQYQHVFKPKGYLYSVFGGMIDGIPNLETYKIVWMVRDPRDILVSSYFSMAYSHPLPGKRSNKKEVFLEKRKYAQDISIDEYVLAESVEVKQVYDRYFNLLLDNISTAYITKYEDMVANHEVWLDNLLAYCALNIEPSVKQQLLNENQRLKPKSEDVRNHNRKGQPGDYKEKLKSETIAQLNSIFADVLARLKYDSRS